MPFGDIGNIREHIVTNTNRTTQFDSNDMINDWWQKLILVMEVTAASGTGGLRLRLQGKIPGGGNFFPLNEDAPFVTATGTYVYLWYPGADIGQSQANVVQAQSVMIPSVWRFSVEVGDASAYSYSISAFLNL